jgi:hypothetical protein
VLLGAPDYKQPGLHNPKAYRSSDPDPVMVGLRLGEWRKVWLPVVVVSSVTSR